MKTKEQELATAIGNGVNIMCFSNKEFCEAMDREHRTLQQSFTRLAVAWLYHLANKQEYQYDLRNEASVKAGKAVKAALGEYGPPLPHI